MKQVNILVIAFLLVTVNTFSQSEKSTRLSFVLSPQISWLSSDNKLVDSNGSLSGYNFGVVMDRFFAENYAFTTGLTVNTTGGKLKYNITPEEATTPIGSMTYRLKYLEVPFALKLVTNEFRRSRYYGQFGLYSQFNIKTNDGEGNNINDAINFFDMGYLIGGGMEYSLGGDNFLLLGINYGGGFLDVTDHIADDKATMNRLVFQFGIIF